MKSARFAISLIVLIACLMAGFFAAAGQPCDEAQAIRQERISFDIEMRRKRVELRRQVLDLQKQDADMDEKMAAIEEEILASPDERVETLWRDLEEISKQRDALWPKIDELRKQYSEVSWKRMNGKNERKVQQLEKRLECVLNAPLTAKLAEIGQKLSEKGSGPEEVLAFSSLAEQRAAALDALKQESARYRKELDELEQERLALGGRIDALSQEEEAADAERDKRLERIDALFDQWSDALDQARGQAAELSKKIMPQLERFEGKVN